VSALRAACLTTFGTPVVAADESPSRGGRPIDGMSVTCSRDDGAARIVHVATVRDVPVHDGCYRVRVWHELSAISAN